MFKILSATVVIALLIPLPSYSEGNPDDYRAKFAESVFVDALLTLHSDMPPFKDRARVQHSSSNVASLAIQSLESNPSKKALTVLAELNMFVLDGAVGEEHGCAVLRKGKKILNTLKNQKAINLKTACENKVNKKDGNLEICAPTSTIERNLRDQISAVSKGEKCDD
jgi:hypothetical protein